MTRISFYVLASAGPDARERFACRVAEKAYRRGHDVYLHVASPQQAEALDDMMWTFRAASFLPHERVGSDAARTCRVVIGCEEEPGEHHDVLVNLALDIPDFFSRFERVTEIVTADPSTRDAKRECYRFYQQRGYPSEHHRVSDSQLADAT